MAIQTFGDYCRWHPHLHAIVSDGSEMKIISFIVQADVIKKILVHLELWEEPESPFGRVPAQVPAAALASGGGGGEMYRRARP